MKIRVLGVHNLESQSTRHTCFLVDGVLAIDAGSLMRSLSAEEQRNIQAVLLTHRHFDHVRDLPSLGLSTMDSGGSVALYSLPETLDAISSRLMDGLLYPDFTKRPTPDAPKFRLHAISAGDTLFVNGYTVRPLAVPHGAPTVGYIIHKPEAGSFAYCGDCGGGLSPFFRDPLRPDPLFVEVTYPGHMEERAKLSGHLTPNLLRGEIVEAMKQQLAIPRIMIVHRNPGYEEQIVEELTAMASELRIEIALAREGMCLGIL